jgi:hypothetical protein
VKKEEKKAEETDNEKGKEIRIIAHSHSKVE